VYCAEKTSALEAVLALRMLLVQPPQSILSRLLSMLPVLLLPTDDSLMSATVMITVTATNTTITTATVATTEQAGIAGDGLVLPVERMNKYGAPGFVLGVVEVSNCHSCNCLLV
jgi:hypothetical protein